MIDVTKAEKAIFIFKTITSLQNQGSNILWSQIVDVYYDEQKSELKTPGLRKITYSHMHPTSYSLMNVKLAAQVKAK